VSCLLASVQAVHLLDLMHHLCSVPKQCRGGFPALCQRGDVVPHRHFQVV